MTFVIGRGFAELQILKNENDPISWTKWNIVMNICLYIYIDKI